MLRFITVGVTGSLIALTLLLPKTVWADGKKTVPGKHVTFYTTYGYREGNTWIIPLRIWVREKSDAFRRLAAKGARRIVRKRAGLENLDENQKDIFMSRAEDFVADSDSGEVVVFGFDNDPDDDTFQLKDKRGNSRTDHNGLIDGFITLTDNKVKRLLDAQASEQGWLTYRAVSKNHVGTGNVRLLEPAGVSVISDIDDTIKVTEIPAGEEVVLTNTFFRDFVAAPCMPEMYRAFDQTVAFHYVSGGPWQLYGPLAHFLFSESVGFPSGSFHMKNVRINPFESESYQDLWKLIRDGSKQTTFEQKIGQISALMVHFPRRKFILIGDSGEHDPEVFRVIREQFSDQVIEIRIRDITNDQEINPHRLDKMRIIPPSFGNGGSCRDYLER